MEFIITDVTGQTVRRVSNLMQKHSSESDIFLSSLAWKMNSTIFSRKNDRSDKLNAQTRFKQKRTNSKNAQTHVFHFFSTF